MTEIYAVQLLWYKPGLKKSSSINEPQVHPRFIPGPSQIIPRSITGPSGVILGLSKVILAGLSMNNQAKIETTKKTTNFQKNKSHPRPRLVSSGWFLGSQISIFGVPGRLERGSFGPTEPPPPPPQRYLYTTPY